MIFILCLLVISSAIPVAHCSPKNFDESNLSNSPKWFFGTVVPRSLYKVTLTHQFGTINVESDEEGEFEADLGPKVTEEEEIRIEISKTNGQKIHVWTMAWLSPDLVHQFNFGVIDGPSVLKWKFTNFGEILKPNVQYRWIITTSNPETIIGEDKFQVGEDEKEKKMELVLSTEQQTKSDKEWQITIYTKEETNVNEFFLDPLESCSYCFEAFELVEDAWRPEECENHAMHKSHLDGWFVTHNKCPYCGKTVSKKLKQVNSVEDKNMVGRTSELMDRIVAKFSIRNPVLSKYLAEGQSTKSWANYEFFYNLDCSKELYKQWDHWHENADNKTYIDNKFNATMMDRWLEMFMEEGSWGQSFFVKKPNIGEIKRRMVEEMINGQTVTVETRMEHWMKSAESDRMLMEVISSYGEQVMDQVRISSVAIEKLFTVLSSVANPYIVQIDEDGLFNCNAEQPKLDIFQFDQNQLIDATEIKIDRDLPAVINIVAVKKLFALAIRMSLIIGNNPQRLQSLVAAYKCITLPGHDNLFRTQNVLEGDENNFWMSEVINKSSAVLADITPFAQEKKADFSLQIQWQQRKMKNRSPLNFIERYFGLELTPREMMALVDFTLKKLDRDSLSSFSRDWPMIVNLAKRLEAHWELTGSKYCATLKFCQETLKKLENSLKTERQFKNFKYNAEYKQRRIVDLARTMCPGIFVQQKYKSNNFSEEYLLELKGLPNLEEIIKIDMNYGKIWKEFLDNIELTSNSDQKDNKKFIKAMRLYEMEFMVSIIPPQMRNEFTLEPLVLYETSDDTFVSDLIKELWDYGAKSYEEYCNILIKQIGKENNTKNCVKIYEKFQNAWKKMKKLAKVMADQKRS